MLAHVNQGFLTFSVSLTPCQKKVQFTSSVPLLLQNQNKSFLLS